VEKMIFIKRASPFCGRDGAADNPTFPRRPSRRHSPLTLSGKVRGGYCSLIPSLMSPAYPLFLLILFYASPSPAAVNLLSPAGGATGVSQSPALAAADLAQTEVRYPGTRWIMRYETQNVPLISVTGQES